MQIYVQVQQSKKMLYVENLSIKHLLHQLAPAAKQPRAIPAVF